MIIMPAKDKFSVITIRHIQLEEVALAKRLIYGVAHQIFHDDRPLEETITFYEARGQLHDIDDLQNTYGQDHGIFLVMLDGDQLIGTGAVRKMDDELCELKRLWLSFDYHGQKLGYRMM